MVLRKILANMGVNAPIFEKQNQSPIQVPIQIQHPHQSPRQIGNLSWANRQRGGVIVEYILVTTFTLAAGAATLNYLMKLMREKMENLEQTIDQPEGSSWSDLLQNP